MCLPKGKTNTNTSGNSNNGLSPKVIGFYSLNDGIGKEEPKIQGLNFKSSNDTSSSMEKKSVKKKNSLDLINSLVSPSTFSIISEVSTSHNLGVIKESSTSDVKIQSLD